MTLRFQRRAEWVWRPRGVHAIPFGVAGLTAEEEKNRYVYFRRTFSLERDAHNAFVFVSADGRYQLFVNGHRVRPVPLPSDRPALRIELRWTIRRTPELCTAVGRDARSQ